MSAADWQVTTDVLRPGRIPFRTGKRPGSESADRTEAVPSERILRGVRHMPDLPVARTPAGTGMVRYRNHTPQAVTPLPVPGRCSGRYGASSAEYCRRRFPNHQKRRRKGYRASYSASWIPPPHPCETPETASQGTLRAPAMPPPYAHEGRHRASCAACGLCQLNPLNATHRTTERPERNKAYADPNPSESLRGRHLASSNPPPAHTLAVTHKPRREPSQGLRRAAWHTPRPVPLRKFGESDTCRSTQRTG